MRRLISNRFNVIKVLRDRRGISTLLASDLCSDKASVIIKTFRRAQFEHDRAGVEKTLSIFMGMSHPNIIPLLDGGVLKSEDFYLVREYVPEVDPLLRQNVQHIRSLVSTVMFLNSMGYVHGNIKPTNIFISNNTLRLSDPKLGIWASPDSVEE